MSTFVDVAPDAVRLALASLEELDVPVSGQVPRDRPDRFVTVRQIGGHQSLPVQHARAIAAEAYAPTEPDAQALAEEALACLRGLAGTVVDGVATYRVDVITAPTVLQDQISQTPKARTVVHLYVRRL